MTEKNYMEIWLECNNAEIVEKIEILHLERGIQYSEFITKAIAEKLQKSGYLQSGVRNHMPQKRKKEVTDAEDLRMAIMRINMRGR